MTVRFAESFEEMLDIMSRDQEIADESIEEWQHKIKIGDCFERGSMNGIRIFCEILDPAVPIYPVTDPDELEEIQESAKIYREPYMQGFRFCKAYSAVCPEGEYGDVHVSQAGRIISREEFEAAVKGFRF